MIKNRWNSTLARKAKDPSPKSKLKNQKSPKVSPKSKAPSLKYASSHIESTTSSSPTLSRTSSELQITNGKKKERNDSKNYLNTNFYYPNRNNNSATNDYLADTENESSNDVNTNNNNSTTLTPPPTTKHLNITKRKARTTPSKRKRPHSSTLVSSLTSKYFKVERDSFVNSLPSNHSANEDRRSSECSTLKSENNQPKPHSSTSSSSSSSSSTTSADGTIDRMNNSVKWLEELFTKINLSLTAILVRDLPPFKLSDSIIHIFHIS